MSGTYAGDGFPGNVWPHPGRAIALPLALGAQARVGGTPHQLQMPGRQLRRFDVQPT